jgi:Ca2+-transporting ATPase
MIEVGQHLFGSVQIGQSIAFTAFALCLIVAAVECRSETGTTQINLRQFGWSLIPALALLVLWELGKYVARRQGGDHLDAEDKTG